MPYFVRMVLTFTAKVLISIVSFFGAAIAAALLANQFTSLANGSELPLVIGYMLLALITVTVLGCVMIFGVSAAYLIPWPKENDKA